ncbi:MAG: phosphonate metabolism protein PhnP [Pseudomonadota bacterium]|nr:phosphonate metabolism protein PhnP [Pseudomonadota bacterium]
MAIEFKVLGSGNAAGVPVFGCDCAVCERARLDGAGVRHSSCGLLIAGSTRLLVDAGHMDLVQMLTPSDLTHVLLTHYHVDHVQGLFRLRWGKSGRTIPVFSPPDAEGCADLYKHPGLLDYQPALRPFETFELPDLKITPVPLQHSKPTFGYIFESKGRRLAYLTDTVGLPVATREWLVARRPDVMFLDCSFPPLPTPNRNHNDLNMALAIQSEIGAERAILTHVDHKLDCWRMAPNATLPDGVEWAYDGLEIRLPVEESVR